MRADYAYDLPHGADMEITYTPTGTWAGIYWLYPIGNWGTDSSGGHDLTGASRLVFEARGANGGEKSIFKTGGVSGTYGDSFGPVSSGTQTLTSDWTPYSIDLQGKDLSNIVGGFCWVSSSSNNPSGAVIYVKDIKFE